jgi:hypothetical protein
MESPDDQAPWRKPPIEPGVVFARGQNAYRHRLWWLRRQIHLLAADSVEILSSQFGCPRYIRRDRFWSAARLTPVSRGRTPAQAVRLSLLLVSGEIARGQKG